MDDRAVSDDLEPYSGALFDEVVRAVPAWLHRSIGALLDASGTVVDASVRARLDEVVDATRDHVARELSTLLAQDVDAQRSNPLHVLRQSTVGVTRLLEELGVPHVRRDEFDASSMPGDVYALGPLTWKDLSESVHDAGITWGAWKAATVMQRRRAEGRT